MLARGDGGGPVGSAGVVDGEVDHEVPTRRGEILDDDEGVAGIGADAVTSGELGEVAGLGQSGCRSHSMVWFFLVRDADGQRLVALVRWPSFVFWVAWRPGGARPVGGCPLR